MYRCNKRKSLGGLSHYPVVEIKNTTNGRTKMHAKLLYPMDQQPIELKGCTKQVEP
jgi:hypothetical protein